MKISDFLGSHVSVLLRSEPFDQWPVERSIEEDLEENETLEIDYVFDGHALSLRCDSDDRIIVIFLEADKRDPSESELFEVPFEWTRQQVNKHFGSPEKKWGRVVTSNTG